MMLPSTDIPLKPVRIDELVESGDMDRKYIADIQAVLPHDYMDNVIDNAEQFAVAHCTCRVQADLMGRACDHPLEVCLKFDALSIVYRGDQKEIPADFETLHNRIRKEKHQE